MTDYRGAATGRISPRFPTVDEAEERLRKRNETIVARALLLILLASPLIGYLRQDAILGWIVAVVGLVGFVATCFYAGSRQTKRMTGA